MQPAWTSVPTQIFESTQHTLVAPREPSELLMLLKTKMSFWHNYKLIYNAKIALKLHWIANYFILLICINFFSIFTIGFPILNIHFHHKRQLARGQTNWQTLTKWQNTWEQFFQYINGMNYKNCCYCLCKFY